MRTERFFHKFKNEVSIIYKKHKVEKSTPKNTKRLRQNKKLLKNEETHIFNYKLN